MPIQDALL